MYGSSLLLRPYDQMLRATDLLQVHSVVVLEGSTQHSRVPISGGKKLDKAELKTEIVCDSLFCLIDKILTKGPL